VIRLPRAAALALALIPAAALAQQEEDGFLVERDNVEISPAPHVVIRKLDIDNRLGDITVIGRDQPGISLVVVKRAPDEDTLERLKVRLVPDPEGGSVRISSAILVGEEARPIAAGTVRIDIQVHAPRGAHARARAWNGRLGVTGMEDGADLVAHEGDIVVTSVKGTVSTTGMRGKQRLTDVSGSVTADETYGDVALDGITGARLAARVHRGTVTATRVRTEVVSITTTFGDIHFQGELAAAGRYELRSYRGDVVVRTSGAFEVEAWSRDGRVEPTVSLGGLRRDGGRLFGSFGQAERPAVLLLSSTVGRVTFGLTSE
jgi:hypothetical protein